MKKLSIFLLTYLIISLSLIRASASSVVSFTMSDAQSGVNRVFTQELIAESDIPISAATFEITYDKASAQFQSVLSDDNSEVEFNEADGKIMVSYLCENGKDISNGSPLFTLKFKAVLKGDFFVNFTVYDCVDNKIESMEITSCTSGSVHITETAASNQGRNLQKDNRSQASASNQNNKKNVGISVSATEDELQDLGMEENTKTESGHSDLKMIFITAGAFIVVLLLGYIIGKNLSGRGKDIGRKENSENNG